MPAIAPEVVELKSLMFAHRLNTRAVCERADMHIETWWRWGRGSLPTLRLLRKMRTAVDEMIAEQNLTPEGE